MPIIEKKYQKLFEEAQADAIRFRQDRDRAMQVIRLIGRLSGEPQIEQLCKDTIAGRPLPIDTVRLDRVERECADIELTCGGVWRVSGIAEDYEADSLRGAIDKLIEATGGLADGSRD